ncbi:methyltransferase domain-containing protein [Niveispirillum fermenti]|uniref:methyltransferase domain-containing protein n=1 Tax=Niveispirillum fermenti TaxID=1233113 RepID=UPI003A8832D0
MQWNPSQYERFRAPRERPGRDLLAALPPLRPGMVTDLGCGTGYLTRQLADRFPDAAVTGLDSDPAMLARAAAIASRVRWRQGDIATWVPDAPQDLIFSNAALQWLPGHDVLFPCLAGCLTDGGVLAVQMPDNFDAPSHLLLRETAADGPWAPALRTAMDHHHALLSPADYWRLLRPHCGSVDIWSSDYLHVLEGADPVLEWTAGTALLPVMARLPADQAAAFREAYANRLRLAYPAEGDGRTLFPFRRLFIVARI